MNSTQTEQRLCYPCWVHLGTASKLTATIQIGAIADDFIHGELAIGVAGKGNDRSP
jgi:hypothetical protein